MMVASSTKSVVQERAGLRMTSENREQTNYRMTILSKKQQQCEGLRSRPRFSAHRRIHGVAQPPCVYRT
jgi:hypothetical protein